MNGSRLRSSAMRFFNLRLSWNLRYGASIKFSIFLNIVYLLSSTYYHVPVPLYLCVKEKSQVLRSSNNVISSEYSWLVN